MTIRIDPGSLGALRDSEEFRTNTRRLAQFAEALGGTDPVQLDGRTAHPVFAHIPTMQSMVEVLQRAAPGTSPLHGEHDFQLHRPLGPGMRLFSTSVLVGMRPTGAGAALIVRSTTEAQDGTLVATQTATCIVPDAAVEPVGLASVGRPAPAGGDERPVTIEIPADQAMRYAEAARDYSPYTIEDEAARRLGFPAPILHGMCTLGLAANALGSVAGAGRRIERLGCRFTAPLFMRPGQALTVAIRLEGDRASFRATDRDGTEVVRLGYASFTA